MMSNFWLASAAANRVRLEISSALGYGDFMRNRGDELSESFLAPDDPGPEPKHSILLIVAGRMHGEGLRYQLVCRGFEVELARSVSAGVGRMVGSGCEAVVLDWQTLAVEYAAADRAEAWARLV